MNLGQATALDMHIGSNSCQQSSTGLQPQLRDCRLSQCLREAQNNHSPSSVLIHYLSHNILQEGLSDPRRTIITLLLCRALQCSDMAASALFSKGSSFKLLQAMLYIVPQHDGGLEAEPEVGSGSSLAMITEQQCWHKNKQQLVQGRNWNWCGSQEQ